MKYRMIRRIRKYIGATPFFRCAVANGTVRAGHAVAQGIPPRDSAVRRRASAAAGGHGGGAAAGNSGA